MDISKLDRGTLYAVRSSAAAEDSADATAAGRFETILSVGFDDLGPAIARVKEGYNKGAVILQPDLSSRMMLSGVAYTNLNGRMLLNIGRGCHVQRIVKGEGAETTVSINNEVTIKGAPISPALLESIREGCMRVERYFGRPMDVEFAVIDKKVIYLQARPLPSPTAASITESEVRRISYELRNATKAGLSEVVLGVGNYREILGDSAATNLSVSTFNYVFAGDGESVPGAAQLGRNELGYDVGMEISPCLVYASGKVYYNFAGDAMQFRPKGIRLEDFMHVVNNVYIPMAKGDPDLLNYPELRMYAQFPEQAEQVGLDPEPFRKLAENNRRALLAIEPPATPPEKEFMAVFSATGPCLTELRRRLDAMRTGSAKEYVKAARLAFFALEDIRLLLSEMRASDAPHYTALVRLFGSDDPEKLRDAIVYNESIRNFEVPREERFKYLGSFELSLERGFPPERRERRGVEIADLALREKVFLARRALEMREKKKFFLLRDLDVVRQLYLQMAELTNAGTELFSLGLEELYMTGCDTLLARYRSAMRREAAQNSNAFGEPIFGSTMRSVAQSTTAAMPELVFGKMEDGEHRFAVGTEAKIVRAVDQTVEVSEDALVLIVPPNIRPGSHLFTVLSDYNIPVVSLPAAMLGAAKDATHLTINKKGNALDIVCD